MHNSTLWEYDLRYLNRKSIVTLDILFHSSFLLFLAITFPPVFPSHFSFFLKRNKEEEKSNVQYILFNSSSSYQESLITQTLREKKEGRKRSAITRAITSKGIKRRFTAEPRLPIKHQREGRAFVVVFETNSLRIYLLFGYVCVVRGGA